MSSAECLFCGYDNPEEHTIVFSNHLSYVRLDNFPVSLGHIEVVPIRHVESLFNLTDEELLSVHKMLGVAREYVEERYHPDAYNIGVNEGRAAGRTIDHCHFHLIPRYEGDVEDPRGGIRHVIPGSGYY